MDEKNNKNKGWFDFEQAMSELKADENKVYLDNHKNENSKTLDLPQVEPIKLAGRERIRESIADNEETRRMMARRNLARRQAERERKEQLENALKNTRKVKDSFAGREINTKDLLQRINENKTIKDNTTGMVVCKGFVKVARTIKNTAKKVLNNAMGKVGAVAISGVVLAGTFQGLVGCTLNNSNSLENEVPDNQSIEQEANEATVQDLAKASELAEKGELTEEEIQILNNSNVGNNPSIGQFGTEQGYTPLSEDPSYKDPNLQEFKENVYEETTYNNAMEKFKNGEALTQEEAESIKYANTHPEQIPVGHFDGEPLVEQSKTM